MNGMIFNKAKSSMGPGADHLLRQSDRFNFSEHLEQVVNFLLHGLKRHVLYQNLRARFI